MKINPEQAEAFVDTEMSKFEVRVAKFLQEHFYDARELPIDDMTPVIRNQIKKAKKYGLITEYEVTTYVTTAWQLGEEFDNENPPAIETLNSVALSGRAKADWLAQWTTEIFSKLDNIE